MREYHKIETLYERDTTGSKKLIPGKWRNETVQFLANNEWVIVARPAVEVLDRTGHRVIVKIKVRDFKE